MCAIFFFNKGSKNEQIFDSALINFKTDQKIKDDKVNFEQ